MHNVGRRWIYCSLDLQITWFAHPGYRSRRVFDRGTPTPRFVFLVPKTTPFRPANRRCQKVSAVPIGLTAGEIAASGAVFADPESPFLPMNDGSPGVGRCRPGSALRRRNGRRNASALKRHRQALLRAHDQRVRRQAFGPALRAWRYVRRPSPLWYRRGLVLPGQRRIRGAGCPNRTDDLPLTRRVLYQLS